MTQQRPEAQTSGFYVLINHHRRDITRLYRYINLFKSGEGMESLFTGRLKRWITDDRQIGNESHPGIPDILISLLNKRGIQTPNEIEQFLKPDMVNLYDPFLMKDMDKSADRIRLAVENHESVLIYGDYDVDGVTAVSILVRFFRSLGLNADYYIPDRVEEGYGISEAAIEIISRTGYDLMITVDCGIAARIQVDAIHEKCRMKGRPIDIIITDHHQSQEEFVPKSFAVVNPHLPDCCYPFKHLCGAGIVLKLVQAAGTIMGNPEAYKNYLDLAALATIADIVDMKDENRIITKFGIDMMNNGCCMGIRALLSSTGIQPGTIDSGRVSYVIAPRVNAAGRMGDAKRAVILFTTDDEEEARHISEELEHANSFRQGVQNSIYEQAVGIIESDKDLLSGKIIIVHGESWHHGVVGIVASKLVDRYHKPAFVLSIEGDTAVGSGRSVEGFNLFQCMEACGSLLIKFGGHAQAGGLTLKADNIGAFKSRINAYAAENLSDSLLEQSLNINCIISPCDISMETAKQLRLMEPYGQGNNMPVLLMKGVAIADKKLIGGGKHLKLKISLNRQTVDAVFFGRGNLEKYIKIGDAVDIVFHLEINLWQNFEYLQMRILDMRLEEKTVKRNRFLMEAARRFELLDCDDEWLYNGINEKLVATDDIQIKRDDLAAVYRYILRQDMESAGIVDLFWHARKLADESGRNVNFYKFVLALFIFDELELIGFSLQNDGRYGIKKYEGNRKVNLEESELFAYLQETTGNCG